MKSFWSFLKQAGKWALILGAIYIVTTLFSGFDFETRVGWLLAALGMAIAYVDGTQKDRIANLEYRINELSRRIDN